MPQAACRTLEIRLCGPLDLRWDDGEPAGPRGAKQRALLALLASAPNLARSRTWLQATLWGRAGQSHGRASLRQALSEVRGAFGDEADRVLDVTTDQIAFHDGGVRVFRDPADGVFLEGIDIDENGFEDWLRQARSAAAPLCSDVSGSQPQSLRPRIAVLPFARFAQGDGPDALGDALAQELLRILSRVELIDVISHLSSRALRPLTSTMANVRAGLGCDYLVTGTYRMGDGRITLEMDFHDVATEVLSWSSEAQIAQAAFLAGDPGLLANLAGDIVNAALVSSVRQGAIRPMPDLATHKLLMSAIGLMFNMGDADFGRAGRQLAEVAKRAPRHALPFAWAAQWHLLRVFQGQSPDAAKDRQKAEDAVARALDLDPLCAYSLAMDGNVLTVLYGEFDAARDRFDRALELDPSNAAAHQYKSILHSFLGEAEAAVNLTARTRILSPRDPRMGFFDGLGAAAYLAAGAYDTAVEMSENAIRVSPRHISAHRARVVGLQLAGRAPEARDAAAHLLRQEPGLTIHRYLANHPAADLASGQLWAGALQAAGVPTR